MTDDPPVPSCISPSLASSHVQTDADWLSGSSFLVVVLLGVGTLLAVLPSCQRVSRQKARKQTRLGKQEDKLRNVANGQASGLKWKEVGTAKPTIGTELTNPKLSQALKTKQEFLENEWDSFGITDLSEDDFVWLDGAVFKPAALSTTLLASGTFINVAQPSSALS